MCNIAKKSIYGYYIRFIIKKIQIDFGLGAYGNITMNLNKPPWGLIQGGAYSFKVLLGWGLIQGGGLNQGGAKSRIYGNYF